MLTSAADDGGSNVKALCEPVGFRKPVINVLCYRA